MGEQREANRATGQDQAGEMYSEPGLGRPKKRSYVNKKKGTVRPIANEETGKAGLPQNQLMKSPGGRRSVPRCAARCLTSSVRHPVADGQRYQASFLKAKFRSSNISQIQKKG